MYQASTEVRPIGDGSIEARVKMILRLKLRPEFKAKVLVKLSFAEEVLAQWSDKLGEFGIEVQVAYGAVSRIMYWEFFATTSKRQPHPTITVLLERAASFEPQRPTQWNASLPAFIYAPHMLDCRPSIPKGGDPLEKRCHPFSSPSTFAMGLHSLVLSACIVGAILTLGSYLRNRTEMRRRNPQGLPYPPGPRGLPIVGNVLDMPRKQMPLTYRKWNEQYGPMTYVVAVGKPTLVISSYDIAKELLDKRGSNYINRPRLVMAGELSGLGKAMGLTQYGSLWKKEKRYLSKALSGGPIVKRDYSGVMIKRATILLKSMLDRPQDFLWEIKKMTGHTVMEVGYGAIRDDEDGGHDYIDMQFELGQITARTIQGYWVDFFPWLKHIPTWFPGAQFKRDGLRWGKQYDTVRDYMFERIKKRVLSADQGKSLPSSFVRNTLRDVYAKSPSDREELKEEEDAIKYSSFSFYRAGADAPECAIRSFLLAMSLYPEFQVRARAEVDRVIGPDRLPTIDDRGKETMPYVEAVVLEALRWNPPAGTGVPHIPLHDDTYGGYFIPKGTIVTPNIWSMSRDPAYYANPSDFTPERFLIIDEKTSSVAFNRATLDPCEYTFGFGRRICPGLDLSVQELWIAVVFILWAFEIKKKGEGKWDTDEDRFTFAFTPHTKPFDCNLVPRSDKVKDIINDAYSVVESLERRK